MALGQPEMSDRFHVSPDLQASVRELTDGLSEVPPAADHFSGSLHFRTTTEGPQQRLQGEDWEDYSER